MSAAARTKTRSFFASASKRIGFWLEHHPVASNSILCLNLWVLGDFVAQYSEHDLVTAAPPNETTVVAESKDTNEKTTTTTDSIGAGESLSSSSPPASFWTEQLDLVRTAQCASYGAFVTGPILALWYPYMDRVCLRYKVALRYGPWAAPIAKVAADEFVMDPPNLLMFFGYMNACEGGSTEDFVAKVRTQFFPSWCTSLAVWPVVLLGTFRFLPVPVQAPVINVCCIVWDAFLSHRNALAKHSQQQQQQQQQTTASEDGDHLAVVEANDKTKHGGGADRCVDDRPAVHSA
mmetsp:Transcript_62485/g.127259  ORF Transcript_62485/g.127259 Transcript_62485/m.127259 type:complete len:291 (-) Transcript_62485:326-1198(-)